MCSFPLARLLSGYPPHCCLREGCSPSHWTWAAAVTLAIGMQKGSCVTLSELKKSLQHVWKLAKPEATCPPLCIAVCPSSTTSCGAWGSGDPDSTHHPLEMVENPLSTACFWTDTHHGLEVTSTSQDMPADIVGLGGQSCGNNNGAGLSLLPSWTTARLEPLSQTASAREGCQELLSPCPRG